MENRKLDQQCSGVRRIRIGCAVLLIVLAPLSAPAHGKDREYGHERSACMAWDAHLRYLLEQRLHYGTLTSMEGDVILDEVKHASRVCEAGKFRNALDRFAALFDLLSGDDEEREDQI